MVSNQTASSILVVDDEINLRHTLALILQRAGYTVTAAGNGQEARKYLENGNFDLVFLDLKMPDIDGIVLLPEIRRLYPELPVLILTAHATLDSAIHAVRLGARDYLLKPIDPAQILVRVKEVLAESVQPKHRRKLVGEIKQLLEELNRMEGNNSSSTGSTLQQVHDPTRYLQLGPFLLDLHARYLVLNDKNIPLSPTAFDYLVTLVRHSPDPVSYETLVMESQGYQTSLTEARDLARWRIHELRKALETNLRQPKFIITVRGTGYRLVI